MKEEDYSLPQQWVKGIQQAVVQTGMMILLFIFFSAATATDPFFRKKFGERYFTILRFWLSYIGWNLAIGISGYFYLEDHHNATSGVVLQILGYIIYLGYLIVSILHFRSIRKRQISGERWHSRSRGVSIFGSENLIRDVLIDILVFFLLLPWLPFAAGFYALSRILGYIGEVLAKRRLYNRFLDIRDAQIEAEFMEAALREGLPPAQAAGLYKPLPKRIPEQQRANIARVVAGQVAAMPAENTFRAPEEAASGAAAAPTEGTGNAGTSARKSFPTTLGSKRFLVIIGILVVAVGLVKGGAVLVHSLQSSKKQTVASRPATIATPTVTPRPEPVEVASAQAPIANTHAPLVMAKPEPVQPQSAPVALIRPKVSTADAVANQQRIAVQAAEKARVAEETARQKQHAAELKAQQVRLTQQKMAEQQAMAKALKQCQDTMNSQFAWLVKFKTHVETKYDSNATNIAKLSWIRRHPLSDDNDRLKSLTEDTLKQLDGFLERSSNYLQVVSSQPNPSLEPVQEQLDQNWSLLKQSQKAVQIELGKLDAKITEAGKHKGFLLFN